MLMWCLDTPTCVSRKKINAHGYLDDTRVNYLYSIDERLKKFVFFHMVQSVGIGLSVGSLLKLNKKSANVESASHCVLLRKRVLTDGHQSERVVM